MRNAHHVSKMLLSLRLRETPRLIAELGAGDGTVMLKAARRLAPTWTGVTLELVDRQSLVTARTVAGFEALGWTVKSIEADAFDWLARDRPVDVLVTNLFLHHFESPRLVRLFKRAKGCTRSLVACEPRRFAYPTLAGNLVWVLGCNAITRHDAVVSIRAGFAGQELSTLWPKEQGWQLQEGEAGLFSHGFCATFTSD